MAADLAYLGREAASAARLAGDHNTADLIGDATWRYYHDAEFHHRVTWALRAAGPWIDGAGPMPTNRTILAISIALVLADYDPTTGLRKEHA